jgi:hypothetical protein
VVVLVLLFCRNGQSQTPSNSRLPSQEFPRLSPPPSLIKQPTAKLKKTTSVPRSPWRQPATISFIHSHPQAGPKLQLPPRPIYNYPLLREQSLNNSNRTQFLYSTSGARSLKCLWSILSSSRASTKPVGMAILSGFAKTTRGWLK